MEERHCGRSDTVGSVTFPLSEVGGAPGHLRFGSEAVPAACRWPCPGPGSQSTWFTGTLPSGRPPWECWVALTLQACLRRCPLYLTLCSSLTLSASRLPISQALGHTGRGTSSPRVSQLPWKPCFTRTAQGAQTSPRARRIRGTS